jgi:hypothetical protein
MHPLVFDWRTWRRTWRWHDFVLNNHSLTVALYFNVCMKTNATRAYVPSKPPSICSMLSNTGYPIHAVSAVPGMTLPEVRKALGHIRQLWKDSTPQQPFFVSNVVHNQRTIAEFCTQFVYGHHLKRHFKSVQQRAVEPATRPSTEPAIDIPTVQDGTMWWQHQQQQTAASGSPADTSITDPTQLWQGECPHVPNRKFARKRQRTLKQ